MTQQPDIRSAAPQIKFARRHSLGALARGKWWGGRWLWLLGKRLIDAPNHRVHGSRPRVGFATDAGLIVQLDLPLPLVRFNPLDDGVALATILHVELTRMEPT